MTKLSGAFLSMSYEDFVEFDWVDQKSGVSKRIKNFVGLAENGDGTRSRISISFPRDPKYRPPNDLEPGQHYLFPVILGFNKKKEVVTYQLRTDIPPLPAPDIQ